MLKTICSFLAIFSILLSSCRNNNTVEPITGGKGKLQLSFSGSPLGNSLTKILSGGITNVVVDIEDALGNSIFSNKVIHLININGEYISEPISLERGNYKLTKFLVTDADDSVKYAAPLTGSQTAYLVNNPLAIQFTLVNDETKKIVPEVVSTIGLSAGDFGYTTFSFQIVEIFNFFISAFKYNYSIQNFEQTTAAILIIKDGMEIYSGSLNAATNNIILRDGSGSYTVFVHKDGYNDYSHQFTNAELRAYSPDPLEVIFYPYDINTYTKLLLNGDGVNLQSVFVESSSSHHNVTPYGNVITDTNVKKFGSASMNFDGDGDFLKIPQSDDFNFGTQDFTIDLWVNFRSLPDDNWAGLVASRNRWDTDMAFAIYYETRYGVNKIKCSLNNGAEVLLSKDFLPNLNTWYHIAIVRYTTKLLLFINGHLESTVALSPSFRIQDLNNPVTVGSLGESDTFMNFFNGNIDNLRISKGVARWTSDFIPGQ